MVLKLQQGHTNDISIDTAAQGALKAWVDSIQLFLCLSAPYGVGKEITELLQFMQCANMKTCNLQLKICDLWKQHSSPNKNFVTVIASFQIQPRDV